jgi:hypothetical protein
MEASSQYIKQGWVWLFAIFIFFFNTFPLPEGITFILLLTPVWVYFLHLNGKLGQALLLTAPLGLYAIIHIAQGVVLSYYLISVIIMACLVIFGVACYDFINSGANWDGIFRDIVVLNFLFAMASVPLLFIPSLKTLVWYMVPISKGIADVPRLKLFASEASHYSYWFAPVAIYFYSRALFFKTRGMWLTMAMVSIPLIMSFSFGVLSDLIITFLLVVAIYFRRIFSSERKRRRLLIAAGLSVGILLIAFKFFPDNVVFHRIHNIFTGDDTSARGRTYEAFYLAHTIAGQKSYLWGIGPGQLKIIGRNIIVQYYFYTNIPPIVRIPNSSAETIAYFGYIGFFIRLFLEAFFFFRTKVYRNPYRMWLFLFAFIFQFTGSYITNPAEYITWIIVFSPVFPDFIRNGQPEPAISLTP